MDLTNDAFDVSHSFVTVRLTDDGDCTGPVGESVRTDIFYLALLGEVDTEI